MIKCEIVTTKINFEGQEITVYGLDFYKDDEPKPFKTIKDLFVELNMAQKLKNTINQSDLQEEHIDNVIDDSLY